MGIRDQDEGRAQRGFLYFALGTERKSMGCCRGRGRFNELAATGHRRMLVSAIYLAGQATGAILGEMAG